MVIIKERNKVKRLIKKSKKIFLMGHKDLDLDAFGSSIGLYLIAKKYHKECFIIIDDTKNELGVEKILKELEGCLNIIKSDEIQEKKHPREKKNLLVILDTNKKELVQSKEALNLIENKLIIDHHEIGKTTIEDGTKIIDTKASSTCEMVATFMEHYDIEMDPYYATILLSGIVLDTNNYTLNTSSETYYISYYLSTLGASAKKVQYLLKQDLEEYTERQKLMAGIETIDGKIAFTKASPYTIYRKEDLARVADTLLFFNNIEASFVIGKIGKNTIGLSARSLGNYDILKVLEKLGGGGDTFGGAAQFEDTQISKVEQELKKIWKEEEE